MTLFARLTIRGRWAKTQSGVELTEQEIKIIIALAQNNMKIKVAARSIPASYQYIRYNLTKLKRRTGLDPRNFFDLMKLWQIVEEISDGTDT